MKLKFDSSLEYQLDAIQAVVDLFEGLPAKQSAFEISLTDMVEVYILFGNILCRLEWLGVRPLIRGAGASGGKIRFF